MHKKRWIRYILLLVILVPLAVLSTMIYQGLNDASTSRSIQTVDRMIPAFFLPTLATPAKMVSAEDLAREYPKGYILHFWASWCGECLKEQPVLQEISRQSALPIIGVSFKDQLRSARSHLTEYGDPYALNISDAKGELAEKLGTYGTPETFLVSQKGEIIYRHLGRLTVKDWGQNFLPLIERSDE